MLGFPFPSHTHLRAGLFNVLHLYEAEPSASVSKAGLEPAKTHALNVRRLPVAPLALRTSGQYTLEGSYRLTSPLYCVQRVRLHCALKAHSVDTGGFEPPTPTFSVSRSTRLRYVSWIDEAKRLAGFEPATTRVRAALPLNYRRYGTSARSRTPTFLIWSEVLSQLSYADTDNGMRCIEPHIA